MILSIHKKNQIPNSWRNEIRCTLSLRKSNDTTTSYFISMHHYLLVMVIYAEFAVISGYCLYSREINIVLRQWTSGALANTSNQSINLSNVSMHAVKVCIAHAQFGRT